MSDIRYTQLLAQHTVANKVQQYVLKNHCKVEHYTDKYKTAWGLTITFPDGSTIEVYDYKQTSMYSDRLPTPKEIMSAKTKLEWHVQCVNSIVLKAFLNFMNS